MNHKRKKPDKFYFIKKNSSFLKYIVKKINE